jgi:hypothetical protein
MLAVPRRSWRIITSQDHSTVRDGAETLFDLNFNAMGIPADERFRLANRRELKPGRYIVTGTSDHWMVELPPGDRIGPSFPSGPATGVAIKFHRGN